MPKYAALTFDFDAISLWIGSWPNPSLGTMSRGEFGPEGVDRILKVLSRHDVPATFFVPGHTAYAYPETVKAIRDSGHEIGHHGFTHERVSGMSPKDERRVMERGLEALDAVIGTVPVGYRSPSWDFTDYTPELLNEHHFQYDSSLMGSDYRPYWVRHGDRYSTDEPYEFGQPLPVVEMPVSWVLDDFPHFEYVRGGVGPANIKSAAQVSQIWYEEFSFFASEISDGCFTLTMHPQVIGRGPRIRMLNELIGRMRETTGVEFATLAAAAAEWRQRSGRLGAQARAKDGQ